METSLNIDGATLDAPHSRTLEEVIGRQLTANQRLIISVIEVTIPQTSTAKPMQTLEDWTHVYNGLGDDEIADIDKIAKTRANLTRNLP